jgi:hypothetical protein
MALPKLALLRAISDDIPLDKVEQLVATYISPDDIAAVATDAIGGDESGTFAGINRLVFVADGDKANFVDPSGVLLHEVRDHAQQSRRARGADPVGLKTQQRTAKQKQIIAKQPSMGM